MMWYDIKDVNHSDPEEISLDIQVPPESGWFSGHFPGEPILPGIAQLGMVFDAINRSESRNIKITGIRRVRFKQIIRPDDPLQLTIKPHKNGSGAYDFRIQVNSELACSGIMTVALRS
jgi:3-hydroxyacyl-[acyl-carrier-protein] dehydratase